MRLWNYAVKVADLDAAAAFYAETMDGEERLAGRVFGCDYRVLRLGGTRLSHRLLRCAGRRLHGDHADHH